jgi:uncharacterized protein
MCAYCHAEADKPGIAQWESVEAAIEYAAKRAELTPKKTLTVSFAVGGEPTLPWDLFRRAVQLIKSLTGDERRTSVERTLLSMTTNGYYGAEKREFIAQHFDTLTLSLDGPPDIQNLHRPTRSGRSSYDLVAGTCAYFLKQSKAKVSLRATVSSRSVGRMSEIVEHFHSEFGLGYTITFEPLVPVGRALHADLVGPPDMGQYTDEFLRARDLGKRLGLRVIVSGASLDRLTSWFCGAMAIPSFAVCLNGAVTACHRDSEGTDYGYGKFTPGMNPPFEADEGRLRGLELLAATPSSCDDCFARFHCAGDCPDLQRSSGPRCSFQRSVLFAQLGELFANERGEHGNGC